MSTPGTWPPGEISRWGVVCTYECGWISTGHPTEAACQAAWIQHYLHECQSPIDPARLDEATLTALREIAHPPEPPIRVSGKMPVRPQRAITS